MSTGVEFTVSEKNQEMEQSRLINTRYIGVHMGIHMDGLSVKLSIGGANTY
jgi:hypothetical protein